jgi:hypothetical protein
MAAAAPVFPRQYDLEFGPFVNGAAAATSPMTPLQTNNSYVKGQLMPHDRLPVGLMFSRGGFLTETFHMPEIEQTESGDFTEPGRSLWMINLVPIRCVAVPNTVDDVHRLPRTVPLFEPGNIINLRWNRRYILEPDGMPQGVLVRAVDLISGDIDDIVPMNRHGGRPDLGPRLYIPKKRKRNKKKSDTKATEMPGLLSRLEALTT